MRVDIPKKYIREIEKCQKKPTARFDSFGMISSDIFKMSNVNYKLSSIYYDCTFRSMLSPIYKGDATYKVKISLEAKKLLAANFLKKFNYHEDNIVVDFFDHRFNELVIGESVITNTDVVIKYINIKYDSVIYNQRDATILENIEYFDQFVVLNKQKKIHVILFELAEIYDDYYIYQLSNHEHNIQKMLRKINTLVLEKYKKQKNINIINMPVKLCVADKNHIEGVAPYHFIPEFYQYAYSQIIKNCK